MNKYLTAIIGILTGIIGILFGLFTSTNSKRKAAEKKAEESLKSQEATEQITEVVSKPTIIDKVEKKAGTLGKMIILFILSYNIIGCAYYEPICPTIVKIEKPTDFQEIEYDYKLNIGYIFDEKNMQELNYQFKWAKSTINKYEQQIDIYNQFKKGGKK